ncbi:extracellular calcium-sensing receptor-like [Lissotriton helveticus]
MHFGWIWVGILAADDDYGQLGSQLLKQELIKTGVCVAFSENIHLTKAEDNAFHITQVMKTSEAMAIVIFSSDVYLVRLFDEVVRQNVTGNIWIASEAWSTNSLLSSKKYSEILSGTIGFAIHSGEMIGFEGYFTSINPATSQGDIFVKRFWEEAFSCQWLDQIHFLLWDNKTKICTGTEKLVNLPMNTIMDFRITYNIYKAVHATALALDNLRICIQDGEHFIKKTCANISDFHPWELLHYIKNVRLSKEDTEGFFDRYGNPSAQYDIVNWQQDSEGTIRHVKVGSYDLSAPPGKVLMINVSDVQWVGGIKQVPLSLCNPSCPPGFRKVTIPGKPICCFQCVPCALGEISILTDSIECFKCPWNQWPNEKQVQCIPKIIEFLSYMETFGAILAAASISLSVIPAIILGLFLYYKNTPVVKASNSKLSYFLLISLSLCFLSSLSFIGYPTTEKCLLRQAAFGVTFAFSVSCILARTIMVVIAFKATKPNSRLQRYAGPMLSYAVIGVGTLIQVLLCVCWLILYPPFSENNMQTHPGKIIIECNEGSPTVFWCMLGYLGFLATISFIIAFLARKLPNSFNEATFITFSMLAFLSVWLSFIPAYLSTKGKYMVAMEIFAILSSSSSLVFCIFLPKCYIIVFRSEKNTKEYIMGSGVAKRKKVKRM